MKKSVLIISLTACLSFLAGVFLISSNVAKDVRANSTDMDSVGVLDGESLDKSNIFFDDFSTGIDSSTWAVSEKVWGSDNNGVRHENLFYDGVNKRVIFRALGDQYEGNLDNGKRTGAAIFTKQEFGPGRYEVKMRAAPKIGVCSAFWTYGDYNDGYNDMYSEIDIEIPTYNIRGDDYRFTFDKMITTSWVGEDEETEKSSESAPIGSFTNNNEFHTYAFDWYYSNSHQLVNWFVDGVLVKTIATNVPEYSARLWVGAWIPANQYFIGMPDFDEAYMDIEYVKYTPFVNQIHTKMNAPLESQISDVYPSSSNSFNSRNFLANSGFNYNSLNSFDITNNVAISHDFDCKSDPNSYGVKISNNSLANNTLSYALNVEGLSSLEYSLMYKGFGSTSIKFYGEGDLSSYNVNVALPSSPSEWSSYSQIVTIPNGAINAVVSLHSESTVGLTIDDWFFGYTQVAPDPMTNTGVSYSFFTKEYHDEQEGWGEKVVTPDGNASKPWKMARGKYFNWKGDIETLAIAPSSNVMTSLSGDEYYPFRLALENANLASEGQNVFLMYQQFDLNYFSDIELSFYAKTFDNIAILYSIDNGTTYSLLTSKNYGQIIDSGDSTFKFNLSASNSLLGGIEYESIRFAIAGLNTSEDSSRLVSMIINNSNDLRNRLDSNVMCSASKNIQEHMEREYSHLSETELEDFSKDIMKHYNQTYEEGYLYLLSYWGGNVNNHVLISLNENNTASFAVAMLFASSFVIIGAIFFYKKFANR